MFGYLIRPFVPSGGVVLSESASIDATPFNSGCLACGNDRTKCGYEFAINCVLIHIPIMRFGSTILSRICHLFEAVSVCVIMLIGTPFQVTSAIIVLVLVDVINARKIVGVRYKSHSNEPMDGNITAEIPPMNGEIPLSLFRFQDFWFPGVPITNTQHPSKVANLVNALVSGRIFPDFLTLHTKSMFMFRANIMKIHEKSNRGVSQHSRLLKTIVLVCGTKIRTIFNLFIP